MTNLDNDKYFQTDEFKRLLRQYEQSNASGGSSFFESEELTSIAEYYQDGGETDKALDAIDYAIRLYPGAIAPLLFRARFALLRENNPDLALQYAEEIEDQTDLEYYYLIAEIMLYQNRAKEANRYLEDCYEELDEEDLDDFIYDVVVLFLDYGSKKYAETWLDKMSLENDLDYTELQARIESTYGSLETSEEKYLELVDIDPYSTAYWYDLASVQFMQGKLQDALSSCEFAIAIDPDYAIAVVLKGNCLLALGRSEEALDYYTRYCGMRPRDPNGEALVGAVLVKMQQTETAIGHYQRALELAHDIPAMQVELYMQLALVYSHIGHVDEALTCLDKAAMIPEANATELKVQRGYVCLENHMATQAGKLFYEAANESDNDPHILYEIGVSAYDNGMYTYAYDILKHLLEADNRDHEAEGWAYFAACCEKLHKDDEFMDALEKACEVTPIEVSMVFGTDIPADVAPKDFYNYMKDKQ